MRSDAYFSDDRVYRYWLLRQWDESKPIVAVIGVNPSTADEKKNDATARKVIGFGMRWGYGGALLLNVGAYCSRDPYLWAKASDPIGPENSVGHLEAYLAEFNVLQTFVAWGNHGWHRKAECDAILNGLPNLWCLGRNANGTPKHPLMVPYRTKPEVWKEHYP